MSKKITFFKILIIPLMFVPLTAALLLYFGDSGLPADTDIYTGVSIESPDGSKFMYSQSNDTFHLITSLLDGAYRDNNAIISDSSEFKIVFFKETDSVSFVFHITEDRNSGYITSERGHIYKVADDALVSFLTSDAAKKLYLGSLPPTALLFDTELSPSIVEWTETLSDGSEVSSGKYIIDKPVKYGITIEYLSEIIFTGTPARTELSAYAGDELILKTTLGDTSPLYELESGFDLILIAEWEDGEGGTIRAGYTFRID